VKLGSASRSVVTRKTITQNPNVGLRPTHGCVSVRGRPTVTPSVCGTPFRQPEKPSQPWVYLSGECARCTQHCGGQPRGRCFAALGVPERECARCTQHCEGTPVAAASQPWVYLSGDCARVHSALRRAPRWPAASQPLGVPERGIALGALSTARGTPVGPAAFAAPGCT